MQDQADAFAVVALAQLVVDCVEVEPHLAGELRLELADLQVDGDWDAHGKLPPSVLAVAGRALRGAENADTPGEVALARVLSTEGRWIVLHGASLVADGARRVAVIVEPADPARISPLLMAAYGLTEREQDVTRLVLRGHFTAQIAADLSVSPHTVQQHLKSVFEKTAVRSRRDLVGKVFFSHYGKSQRGDQVEVAGRVLDHVWRHSAAGSMRPPTQSFAAGPSAALAADAYEARSGTHSHSRPGARSPLITGCPDPTRSS